MGANGKLRIGMYWASSCGGCDISLLEIGPRLLDLIKAAEVVFWPCAADFKYQDLVIAAINQANLKMRETTKEKMASLMGGMNIPGLPGMF